MTDVPGCQPSDKSKAKNKIVAGTVLISRVKKKKKKAKAQQIIVFHSELSNAFDKKINKGKLLNMKTLPPYVFLAETHLRESNKRINETFLCSIQNLTVNT